MYDRKVKDRKLTLTVSGKLWKRSLVMQDSETKSLWSHILGQAMDGELKGTKLTSLPSEMVTWQKWKQAHPNTSVLNLPRSARDYRKSFYRDPGNFVVGFLGEAGVHHCSFATLMDNPTQNIQAGKLPLLVTFDREGVSALLFERQVGDRVLTFFEDDGQLRDRETKTVWNQKSGVGIEGELAGKRLQRHLGIPSFKRAWLTFHPTSHEVGE